MKDTSGDGGSDHQPLPCTGPLGVKTSQDIQRDQRLPLPQFPSPSPDSGFKSDRSSLSMASLMLSMSDRSEGSQHS